LQLYSLPVDVELADTVSVTQSSADGGIETLAARL
jgi:hypothetical protein